MPVRVTGGNRRENYSVTTISKVFLMIKTALKYQEMLEINVRTRSKKYTRHHHNCAGQERRDRFYQMLDLLRDSANYFPTHLPVNIHSDTNTAVNNTEASSFWWLKVSTSNYK